MIQRLQALTQNYIRILPNTPLKPDFKIPMFEMPISEAAQKYKLVSELKSKAKVLRHFKVDPVLKIYATFYSSLDQCVLGKLII